MGTLMRRISGATRKPDATGFVQPPREAALIRAARSGQTAAFNQLVIIYQGALYNVAYRILGDGELASAATREAVVRARQTLVAFGGGSFRLWLMSLLVGICRKELAEWAPGLPAGGAARVGTCLRGEDAQVFGRAGVSPSKVHDASQACLNTVPPEERIVLVLSDIAGLRYREVAEVTGVPVATVRSRLRRGRTALRDTLFAQRDQPSVDPAWYSLSCAH
jgi:RNA polymerase sigma-70 factor (ECF subfamily)